MCNICERAVGNFSAIDKGFYHNTNAFYNIMMDNFDSNPMICFEVKNTPGGMNFRTQMQIKFCPFCGDKLIDKKE